MIKLIVKTLYRKKQKKKNSFIVKNMCEILNDQKFCVMSKNIKCHDYLNEILQNRKFNRFIKGINWFIYRSTPELQFCDVEKAHTRKLFVLKLMTPAILYLTLKFSLICCQICIENYYVRQMSMHINQVDFQYHICSKSKPYHFV